MNRKLGHLLNPSVALYLVLLFAFGIITALMENYVLAAIEISISILVLVIHLVYRAQRYKQLQAFMQDTADEINQVRGAETPFPMALIRLYDGGIVHANEAFIRLTGLADTFVERKVEDFLPGFTTDWLSAGKTEYPYDITVAKQRYRVYGMATRADDPQGTPLGILYLSDLTELYQVRDEYIRSRPVVSIVLVDNYDELTRNMSDGAISALDAQINDTIVKWAQGYHCLLRRLEKNRFLLVFEKRDLNHAVSKKFSILEDIHQISNPSGLAASISMGVGIDGATFAESYEFAALSIEMA